MGSLTIPEGVIRLGMGHLVGVLGCEEFCLYLLLWDILVIML